MPVSMNRSLPSTMSESCLIGAYGAVVDPESVDAWVCELCQNEETQEASLVLLSLYVYLIGLNQRRTEF